MESLNEESDNQTTFVGITLAIFVVLITLGNEYHIFLNYLGLLCLKELKYQKIFIYYLSTLIILDSFFISVVFYFRQKNKSLGRSVLLTGLSDSGKTTIFTRLIHSKIVESYTSIIENVGEIRVNNVSILTDKF